MKEFIEYLIKNLVDKPEQVDVRCFEEEERMRIEVRVDPTDVGKVVGKKGATINAVRTIAMMICARLGRRIRVEVIQ